VTVPYYLLGLAMGSMHATGRTKLSQLHPFRVILLILGGSVVPMLAGCTSQGDYNTVLFSFTSHRFSPFKVYAVVSGFDYIIIQLFRTKRQD